MVRSWDKFYMEAGDFISWTCPGCLTDHEATNDGYSTTYFCVHCDEAYTQEEAIEHG